MTLFNANLMWPTSGSHICNFKCFSSAILNIKRKQVKLILIFYFIHYIQNITILTSNNIKHLKILSSLFFNLSLLNLHWQDVSVWSGCKSSAPLPHVSSGYLLDNAIQSGLKIFFFTGILIPLNNLGERENFLIFQDTQYSISTFICLKSLGLTHLGFISHVYQF